MWPILRATVCCWPLRPTSLFTALVLLVQVYIWNITANFSQWEVEMARAALPRNLCSACRAGGPELTAPWQSLSKCSRSLSFQRTLATDRTLQSNDVRPIGSPFVILLFFLSLWSKKQNGKLFQDYQGLSGSRWEYTSGNLEWITPWRGAADW